MRQHHLRCWRCWCHPGVLDLLCGGCVGVELCQRLLNDAWRNLVHGQLCWWHYCCRCDPYRWCLRCRRWLLELLHLAGRLYCRRRRGLLLRGWCGSLVCLCCRRRLLKLLCLTSWLHYRQRRGLLLRCWRGGLVYLSWWCDYRPTGGCTSPLPLRCLDVLWRRAWSLGRDKWQRGLHWWRRERWRWGGGRYHLQRSCCTRLLIFFVALDVTPRARFALPPVLTLLASKCRHPCCVVCCETAQIGAHPLHDLMEPPPSIVWCCKILSARVEMCRLRTPGYFA